MGFFGLIFAFLAVYWWTLVALVALLLSVVFIVRQWERVRFMRLRAWYACPWIGKTRRLSRSLTVGDDGWFQSEDTLCSDFNSALGRSIEDPDMFDQSMDYLKKAGEIDRSPTSIFGWILISLLVFVESLGFAYVLAGYTLPGASEALQIPGAVAIAFLISVILVFLTHMAGREWHKRGLIEEARVWWEHDHPPETRENLIGHHPAELNRSTDDDPRKPYVQRIRRIKAKANATAGAPGWNIAMIVAVLLVALGAFYVRYETMMSNNTCASLAIGPSASTQFFPSPQSTLPPALTAPDQQNRDLGQQQLCRATEKASIATYLVLALVFVLVQAIGWTIGNRFGFGGQRSMAAWQRVHRFGNRKEYENWLKRERQHVIGIAQRHLANLQNLMIKRARAVSVANDELRAATERSGSRTFAKYLVRAEPAPSPNPGRGD